MAESKFNHKFRITWCFQISRFHYRIFEFGFIKFSNSLNLIHMDCCYPLEYPSIHSRPCPTRLIFIVENKSPMIRLLISLATQRFPQLVAGPIVRFDHFRKEIEKPLRVDSARFRLGLTLIIYGIAKKLVIADNVAIHANAVFTEGDHLTNIGLIWWATLCFGIQFIVIFRYTDIAIGSAHLLGVRLLKISKRLMHYFSARFLEEMAHLSFNLAKRLSLHPTRWFKKWH